MSEFKPDITKMYSVYCLDDSGNFIPDDIYIRFSCEPFPVFFNTNKPNIVYYFGEFETLDGSIVFDKVYIETIGMDI